jgi:hypothetical protein
MSHAGYLSKTFTGGKEEERIQEENTSVERRLRAARAPARRRALE